MTDAATTTLSSKGQVVIPESIRARLDLQPGARFVVLADRDVVIFKLLAPPARKEINAIAARARALAKRSGMHPRDVAAATQRVRRKK
ncbi:MAG: AbrB/MazE/SpoVT family DNA-binding domain-containing protein [Gemmatimonadetes bacterium]|nr:AbrB/MazE/SpoVT family DNA-binding domain-containing protein [Gemmatimonadota bacterium]